MSFKILAINPGSTSTKFAIYEDEKELFSETIDHSNEELSKAEDIISQFNFRKDLILGRLKEKDFKLTDLAAVVGRGGMLPPVEAGGYLVNEAMKLKLTDGTLPSHASNQGALIADAIAAPLGLPAYIYDAVASDEFEDIARITGIPGVTRQSFCHVLNTKAVARKVAAERGRKYEEMNFIVAHIGGGVSITAHMKGRIVDIVSDDEGPFSPERAGRLPMAHLVGMCYSEEYSKSIFLKRLRGNGGLEAHFGTHDCRKVEAMIAAGDKQALLVYQAMAYQISKAIGEMVPVLSGDIDAIILTGGVAHSKMFAGWIVKRIKSLAPVEVLPGEREMEALALGALRILRGEERAKEFK